MRPTGMFKHVNNKDVVLKVLKCFYVKEKRLLKMKVEWWNIGERHRPWPMDITQSVRIPVDDWIAYWKPYEYKEPSDDGAGDKVPEV